MRHPFVMAAIMVGLFLTPSDARADDQPRTDGKPVQVKLGAVAMSVTPPAGWMINSGDIPSYFDFDGKKGNVQFMFSTMPESMPFDVMHKANVDSSAGKVKTGDLESAQERTLGGVVGLLTVEGTKDPSIRRMQWISCNKERSGQFIFTMSSEGAAFEGYRETFLKVLDSVTFPKAEPAK